MKIDGVEIEKDQGFMHEVAKKLDAVSKWGKNRADSVFFSIAMLVFILGYVVFTSYDKDKTSKEIAMATFNFLLGGSLLGQHLLKDYVYMSIENIKPYLTIDENRERLNEFVEEFKKLDERQKLPQDFKNFFERCIKTFDIVNDRYKNDKQKEQYNKDSKNIILFINFVLIFLKPKQRIITNINMIKKLNSDFKTFMDDYESSKDEITESIINPVLLYLGTDIELPSMNAIFLVGSPGVGKTHFVNELASKLNASVERYSSLEEYGDQVNVYDDFEKEYKNLNAVTKLAKKAIENPNKVNILFIDEIDKILLRNDESSKDIIMLLLNLLGDTTNKIIYDRALDIKISIPKNIIIICASNTSLSELAKLKKKLMPLKSRFKEIIIPDLTKEMQIKLTRDYMMTFKNVINIDDSDIKFMSEVVYSSNYKGLRELKSFVDMYVSNKKAIEYFKTVDIGSKSLEDYQIKYLENLKSKTEDVPKDNEEEEEEEEPIRRRRRWL